MFSWMNGSQTFVGHLFGVFVKNAYLWTLSQKFQLGRAKACLGICSLQTTPGANANVLKLQSGHYLSGLCKSAASLTIQIKGELETQRGTHST